MARKFLSPLNLLNLTTDPGSATEGDIYWNSSTNKLRIYHDGSWADISSGGSSLSVQQTNTAGSATETYSSITTLQFDEDSGFDVTNPSAGVAKVAMNSTFKNWNVNGSAGLVAQGLDTVNIISSGAITVAANNTSNPKTLTIGTTGLDEISVDAVAAALSAGTHTNISVSYNDNANSISLTGAATYTDENAQDAVGNAVGNGLDYDDNTGAISVDPSEFALSAVGAPIGNVDFATYKITNLGTPTASGDAATKAYVDNTTAGLNFHAAVHAATTANLDATYANGTGGVGATLTANTNGALIIDGHTLNADERVLIKNQTAGAQNGIYVVTATGDGSNPYILTRATDADNSPAGEMAYGDFTFVQNGSTNAGFGYIVNTTGTITIGTTAINYVQFNAGQVVIAGNGLTESTPGTLAINTAVTVDLNTAQTLTNKTITGSFTGNLIGNADTVTNGVYTSGSYSNPSWITSLAWSKISSAPIVTSTTTISVGTQTTIDSTALSSFTSIEYMVSLKQGSKVRTSKVIIQTDGTSVDSTEFAIVETGGTMTGVSITGTASGSNALLRATVTDANSTNVDVKFSKVAL